MTTKTILGLLIIFAVGFTMSNAYAADVMSITANPNPVNVGDLVSFEITLDGPADVGGQEIILISDGLTSIPASVNAPAGETTVPFSGTALTVGDDQIVASYGPSFTSVILLIVEPSSIPICGDGEINQTSEQCDDGNLINGDGCSNQCLIESPPAPMCGDGVINQNKEQCDDGNLINGDGCSDMCKIESTSTPLQVNPPTDLLAFFDWIPIMFTDVAVAVDSNEKRILNLENLPIDLTSIQEQIDALVQSDDDDGVTISEHETRITELENNEIDTSDLALQEDLLYLEHSIWSMEDSGSIQVQIWDEIDARTNADTFLQHQIDQIDVGGVSQQDFDDLEAIVIEMDNINNSQDDRATAIETEMVALHAKIVELENRIIELEGNVPVDFHGTYDFIPDGTMPISCSDDTTLELGALHINHLDGFESEEITLEYLAYLDGIGYVLIQSPTKTSHGVNFDGVLPTQFGISSDDGYWSWTMMFDGTNPSQEIIFGHMDFDNGSCAFSQEVAFQKHQP